MELMLHALSQFLDRRFDSAADLFFSPFFFFLYFTVRVRRLGLGG